ncbi:DNA repair protein RAD51 homolog 4 [Formica exsecta]|uniref:DNA repair protein RAD51 homolog 4 n=1 Tax=Formica exsecta TaxID=72781 RepID=UPI001144BE7B|nr:DNA repair protein RAD51 homolog 4 [Formica exsecta]XP_029674401.1 DNA repair protein RAD51 homolog 4 [Formica exsecta]XP_029674402.1 DNA repair protein RAD51 homolog 4 [Formica exsecta]XP_029674403.1 DNA repair protein RAD51 homolog 4 [Formica exsecta]XP_029674404.1 DNA repair protein RAD51 homolog 4 [Formica exsecta]XP_029674405.1 DNA repair protein RAD51 homolog 4 [Formica exsecta]XP_029674406.1 DNA repair protein RAD51 homolog 4 [Formica exsecta]
MIKLDASIHPSLSEMVTEKLQRKNVITIVDFVTTDPIKLATFTGLSHTDILEVKKHILKNYSGTKRNAIEVLAIERSYIPINIKCLDELLKGGLYPGQLCELCGPSSSGKTQLCLTIAANIAVQSDIIVYYFDTKRDFTRFRYEEILKAKNFRQEIIENVLQRTKVCHIRSSRDLIRVLRELVTFYKTRKNNVSLEEKRFPLVIIDSLPAVIFKVTRQVHQHDLETTYELDDLAEACRFLTRQCHAIVVTVNSVTQWNSTDQVDPAAITPALGRYWARVPVTRLLIIRQRSEIRKITVWKDLRSDEKSCIVTVSDAGITSQ